MSAILVITTHGDIQVCQNPNKILEENYTQIPDEMTVVSLNVVSAGVPNFLPEENVPRTIQTILKNRKGFDENSTIKQMKNIVKQIRDKLIEEDDQIEFIREQVQIKNEEVTSDPEFMSYYYHPDLLYKIKTHSNRNILNKEFLRENNLLKPRGMDWQLNLFTERRAEPEDLMSSDELNRNVESLRSKNIRSEFSSTNLKKILDVLLSRGIRKLIIIDLSCSVFRKKDRGIDLRTQRRLALSIGRQDSASTVASESDNNSYEPRSTALGSIGNFFSGITSRVSNTFTRKTGLNHRSKKQVRKASKTRKYKTLKH